MKRFLMIFMASVVAVSCFASCSGGQGGGASYDGEYVETTKNDEEVNKLAEALDGVNYGNIKTREVTSLIGAGFSFDVKSGKETQTAKYKNQTLNAKIDYDGQDSLSITYETTTKESKDEQGDEFNMYMYPQVKELRDKVLYLESPCLVRNTKSSDPRMQGRAKISVSVVGEYIDEYLNKVDFGGLPERADKIEKRETNGNVIFKFTLNSYVESVEKKDRENVLVTVEKAVLYVKTTADLKVLGMRAELKYVATDEGYDNSVNVAAELVTGKIVPKPNKKMGDVGDKGYSGYMFQILRKGYITIGFEEKKIEDFFN